MVPGIRTGNWYKGGWYMEKKTAGNIREYSLVGIVVIGVYIGFKYLSPLAAPFLFAFAFVAALHPMLERVQNKYHIKKGILAAGILLLFCVTVGVGVWCLIVFVIQKLGDLFGQIDLFEEKFCIFVGNCCDGIEKKFGMDGAGIERFIMERVNVFIENFQVQVVPRIMDESVGYVKNIVGIVGFLAIMIIAAVLLVKDYNEIMERLARKEELRCMMGIGKKVFCHIGTFIRAQLIILFVISLLCAVTLFLGGFEGGILIGLFTGFMDMLPFIGTGLVLMPLAFWQILNGYYTKAVICVILYVICALSREFMEPKLIGEKMGIFPVAILFSVYAGVKLFGVFGIIKGPLALVTVYEIYLFMKGRKGAYGSGKGTEGRGE